MKKLPTRIALKIEANESGCWLWTSAISPTGYPLVWWQGRSRQAHRVVYELLHEPIPEELTLDHLCRIRSCVNPAHLEPVTVKENVLRGEGVTARNARKTHCEHGHPFTPENTYEMPSGRACRQCRAQAAERYRKGK